MVQAAQQRCADKDVSVTASVNAHRRVADAFTDTHASSHFCAYMRTFVDMSINVDGYATHTNASVNASAADVADGKTSPLQTPVDAYSISDVCANVCACTSLICSGRHQSRCCRGHDN